MKNGNKQRKKDDDFIAPARKAFRRVARQIRAPLHPRCGGEICRHVTSASFGAVTDAELEL